MSKSKVALAFEKTINFRSASSVKRIVCGKFLDYGLFRDVYVCKQNPRYVVKIERDMSLGQFANVTEWRNFIDNERFTKFVKWLAPCRFISENGQFLIQDRVYIKPFSSYPSKVPSLFTDLKYQNFGFIGNQFVCCDYSFLLNVPFRMKKAKWWNVENVPKKLKAKLQQT